MTRAEPPQRQEGEEETKVTTKEEKPKRGQVPMTDGEWQEYCNRMMALPGYICLAVLPSEEWYTGLVENSFSMSTSPHATQFFWSGQARSNFGTSHEMDGWKNARRRTDEFQKKNPGSRVFIFDARNEEDLPVRIDWERWLLDSRPAYNLSGVTNKYGARNLAFRVDTSKPMVV